ncbi:hypothetical protein GTW40_10330 [Streptomyces sp. SID4985]|uniref:hypothetical protein n=1 Tax=unclassified Streptomyces TaxID=2593676 RepID=UPI00136E6282|nr:hypothetical protein [Streptomyces sp. SID4985]MYQ45453.1 hypothetical protein [Streptomyces sp. SID4985]
MDGNRIRRGTVLGAAAAACLLTAGTIGTPAEAAPAAGPKTVAVAASCGNPVLKVWYDSDQFGTYLKAWFETARGCPKGRKVASLSGKIYCFKPKSKLVYSASVAGKKAPTSTLIKALPPKNKCKTFYAESVIVYKGASRTPFKDTWRWNWGGYPA